MARCGNAPAACYIALPGRLTYKQTGVRGPWPLSRPVFLTDSWFRETPVVNELPTITNNGVLVVYIPDIRLVEEARIEGLAAELITLINRTDVSKILLSFRNVKFMGSAMIGKIIQVNKKCRQEKVDLRLCDLNDNLREVFELMKLDKVVHLYASEEKALDAFAGKKKGWFG